MWLIGVEVEHETSAPPPKKNPGSAPVAGFMCSAIVGAFKRPEDNGVVFAVQGVVMRKSSVEMARPSCGLE